MGDKIALLIVVVAFWGAIHLMSTYSSKREESGKKLPKEVYEHYVCVLQILDGYNFDFCKRIKNNARATLLKDYNQYSYIKKHPQEYSEDFSRYYIDLVEVKDYDWIRNWAKIFVRYYVNEHSCYGITPLGNDEEARYNIMHKLDREIEAIIDFPDICPRSYLQYMPINWYAEHLQNDKK